VPRPPRALATPSPPSEAPRAGASYHGRTTAVNAPTETASGGAAAQWRRAEDEREHDAARDDQRVGREVSAEIVGRRERQRLVGDGWQSISRDAQGRRATQLSPPPDHYFSAGEFGALGYALAETRDYIVEHGDAETAARHDQLGDFVPAVATKPAHTRLAREWPRSGTEVRTG
jgi:hypothetical protein